MTQKYNCLHSIKLNSRFRNCHVTVLHMLIKKMVSKTNVKCPVKLQICKNAYKLLVHTIPKCRVYQLYDYLNAHHIACTKSAWWDFAFLFASMIEEKF